MYSLREFASWNQKGFPPAAAKALAWTKEHQSGLASLRCKWEKEIPQYGHLETNTNREGT